MTIWTDLTGVPFSVSFVDAMGLQPARSFRDKAQTSSCSTAPAGISRLSVETSSRTFGRDIAATQSMRSGTVYLKTRLRLRNSEIRRAYPGLYGCPKHKKSALHR